MDSPETISPFKDESYTPPRRAPSFFKRARQRTPHEMIKLQGPYRLVAEEGKAKCSWVSLDDVSNILGPYRLVAEEGKAKCSWVSLHDVSNILVGPTITSQSVPGQNIVLVRARTLGQTNPKEHNGLVPMEGDEEIFEEQAVCKFCFGILKEENILKTECKCGNALIHEECAANWSRMRGNTNCDSCGQEVQTFPVALVRWLGSSTQMVDREESNKWSLFSWLTRIWKA